MYEEEYLTVNELCERIKMAPGTIRNLIWKRQLVQGLHFVRPTPKKILFIWSNVQSWLYGESPSQRTGQQVKRYKSLINI